MKKCNCSNLSSNQSNDEFTENEMSLSKPFLVKLGKGHDTKVYGCQECTQLWGESSSKKYRKLNPDFKFIDAFQ